MLNFILRYKGLKVCYKISNPFFAFQFSTKLIWYYSSLLNIIKNWCFSEIFTDLNLIVQCVYKLIQYTYYIKRFNSIIKDFWYTYKMQVFYLFSEDKCVGCGGIKTSASHQTKLKCGIKDAKDNKHGDESSRPSSPCDACTQTEKKKSNCSVM